MNGFHIALKHLFEAEEMADSMTPGLKAMVMCIVTVTLHHAN